MPFFLQHTHACVEYFFKPLQDNHFEAVDFVLGVIVFLESKSSPSCRFLAEHIRFLSKDFPSYFCLHFTLYPQKSSGAPAWCNHIHASQWECNFGLITPLKLVPADFWISPRGFWQTVGEMSCEVTFSIKLWLAKCWCMHDRSNLSLWSLEFLQGCHRSLGGPPSLISFLTLGF